jgi:hypothetical protein
LLQRGDNGQRVVLAEQLPSCVDLFLLLASFVKYGFLLGYRLAFDIFAQLRELAPLCVKLRLESRPLVLPPAVSRPPLAQ